MAQHSKTPGYLQRLKRKARQVREAQGLETEAKTAITSKSPWQDFMAAAMESWKELKAANWLPIRKLKSREAKYLHAFFEHYEKDYEAAHEAFRAGLIWAANKEDWAKLATGLSIGELMANDKLITYAEKHEFEQERKRNTGTTLNGETEEPPHIGGPFILDRTFEVTVISTGKVFSIVEHDDGTQERVYNHQLAKP